MSRVVITSFRGEHEYLSNFYHEEALAGKTNEHRYQSMKATCQEDVNRVWSQRTPSDAKKVGYLIKARADWDDVRDPAMFYTLLVKFRDNLLAQRILETGTCTLVEGNTWHDNYWGDCVCPKCSNIKGQDKLGKFLMLTRSVIFTFGSTEELLNTMQNMPKDLIPSSSKWE